MVKDLKKLNHLINSIEKDIKYLEKHGDTHKAARKIFSDFKKKRKKIHKKFGWK